MAATGPACSPAAHLFAPEWQAHLHLHLRPRKEALCYWLVTDYWFLLVNAYCSWQTPLASYQRPFSCPSAPPLRASAETTTRSLPPPALCFFPFSPFFFLGLLFYYFSTHKGLHRLPAYSLHLGLRQLFTPISTGRPLAWCRKPTTKQSSLTLFAFFPSPLRLAESFRLGRRDIGSLFCALVPSLRPAASPEPRLTASTYFSHQTKTTPPPPQPLVSLSSPFFPSRLHPPNCIRFALRAGP